jgi:thioredoxin reductase
MEEWDAIVIGGGGAGLAAALTLARAVRRTLVIDGGRQRNLFAAHSHGILGFDGSAPAKLIELGREELAGFGAEFRDDTVTSAAKDGRWFAVETAGGQQLRARQLVVATGVTDELPHVPGVTEHWGKEVVVCPYCDGWEVRGRRIGILATGAKSISQAHLLRQWSDQVVFFANDAVTLSESDELEFAARGIPVEPEAVLGIEVAPESGLTVRMRGRAELHCDVIFTAPRPVPNDAVLRQLGARTVSTPAGLFVSVEPTGATSVAGLWAAGNVVDPSLKVSTAVGNGMATGTHVNEALVRADVADAVAAASSPAPSQGEA